MGRSAASDRLCGVPSSGNPCRPSTRHRRLASLAMFLLKGRIRRVSRVMAAFIGVAVLAATAEAGVSYITLEPEEPGPYPADGRTITVDAVFHNEEGLDVYFQELRLDFSQTDSDLLLSQSFVFNVPWYVMQPDHFYLHFEELPIVDITYSSTEFDPVFMVSAPADGSYVIGWLQVTLPTARHVHARRDQRGRAGLEYRGVCRLRLRTSRRLTPLAWQPCRRHGRSRRRARAGDGCTARCRRARVCDTAPATRCEGKI